MIYGYARCSTNEELQDIDRQKRELKELGATDKAIFFEYESGTKTDRAELEKLFGTAQTGDTIVTTEISRLTRSTRQLCDIINIIEKKRLKLTVKGSITIDCTNGNIDPMTNAFLQITGVFAELERNMISQRVKSGMQNAAAKGKLIGRPITTADDIPSSFYKHYPKYKNGEINKKEFSRLCALSYPTVYKYLSIVEG
ncbi:MAG: recombinase family protein [Bacillota bacterium]|nr:recombinase family protein [Bacillota bacterium]